MNDVEKNTETAELLLKPLAVQNIAVDAEREASALIYKPHLTTVLDVPVLPADVWTGEDGVSKKGPGVFLLLIEGDDNDNDLHGTEEIDTIYGYGGNDHIWGYGGDDIIYGGDGNDTIYYTQRSAFETNHIYGGTGIDTVDYSGSQKGVLINISAQTVTLSGPGVTLAAHEGRDLHMDFFLDIYAHDIENVVGSAYDDVIQLNEFDNKAWGGAQDDYIYGGDGDDRIYGENGDDYLYGDNGADVLSGDAGNDTIYGGTGEDIIYGGSDDDYIYGGSGNDVIYGGADYDHIWGDSGSDMIWAGDWRDVVRGGDGNDSIFGGGGDDDLYGEDDHDILQGGDGEDDLYGGTGLDTLYGDNGDDRLYGDDGNDWLFGGTGADDLHGGAGDDILHGGNGLDNLWGDSGADIFVFQPGVSMDAVDSIRDFSSAQGDRVDISDLLFGYDPAQSAIDDFVLYNAANGNLLVDRDGAGGAYQMQTVLDFYSPGGVGATTAQEMLDNGSLIVV
ncbi:MAG: type I secretion C-terminal target domain-containing protein [Alphaproteobacteria bacterium]|nr:type I secretion C-terminal target domain-containing protein [Alphaproteobacteria bacterium]